MANNRMWLVHEISGERALLATYFPSDGWHSAFGLEEQLETLLQMVSFPDGYEKAPMTRLGRLSALGRLGISGKWSIDLESEGE